MNNNQHFSIIICSCIITLAVTAITIHGQQDAAAATPCSSFKPGPNSEAVVVSTTTNPDTASGLCFAVVSTSRSGADPSVVCPAISSPDGSAAQGGVVKSSTTNAALAWIIPGLGAWAKLNAFSSTVGFNKYQFDWLDGSSSSGFSGFAGGGAPNAAGCVAITSSGVWKVIDCSAGSLLVCSGAPNPDVKETSSTTTSTTTTTTSTSTTTTTTPTSTTPTTTSETAGATPLPTQSSTSTTDAATATSGASTDASTTTATGDAGATTVPPVVTSSNGTTTTTSFVPTTTTAASGNVTTTTTMLPTTSSTAPTNTTTTSGAGGLFTQPGSATNATTNVTTTAVATTTTVAATATAFTNITDGNTTTTTFTPTASLVATAPNTTTDSNNSSSSNTTANATDAVFFSTTTPSTTTATPLPTTTTTTTTTRAPTATVPFEVARQQRCSRLKQFMWQRPPEFPGFADAKPLSKPLTPGRDGTYMTTSLRVPAFINSPLRLNGFSKQQQLTDDNSGGVFVFFQDSALPCDATQRRLRNQDFATSALFLDLVDKSIVSVVLPYAVSGPASVGKQFRVCIATSRFAQSAFDEYVRSGCDSAMNTSNSKSTSEAETGVLVEVVAPTLDSATVSAVAFDNKMQPSSAFTTDRSTGRVHIPSSSSSSSSNTANDDGRIAEVVLAASFAGMPQNGGTGSTLSSNEAELSMKFGFVSVASTMALTATAQSDLNNACAKSGKSQTIKVRRAFIFRETGKAPTLVLQIADLKTTLRVDVALCMEVQSAAGYVWSGAVFTLDAPPPPPPPTTTTTSAPPPISSAIAGSNASSPWSTAATATTATVVAPSIVAATADNMPQYTLFGDTTSVFTSSNTRVSAFLDGRTLFSRIEVTKPARLVLQEQQLKQQQQQAAAQFIVGTAPVYIAPATSTPAVFPQSLVLEDLLPLRYNVTIGGTALIVLTGDTAHILATIDVPSSVVPELWMRNAALYVQHPTLPQADPARGVFAARFPLLDLGRPTPLSPVAHVLDTTAGSVSYRAMVLSRNAHSLIAGTPLALHIGAASTPAGATSSSASSSYGSSSGTPASSASSGTAVMASSVSAADKLCSDASTRHQLPSAYLEHFTNTAVVSSAGSARALELFLPPSIGEIPTTFTVCGKLESAAGSWRALATVSVATEAAPVVVMPVTADAAADNIVDKTAPPVFAFDPTAWEMLCAGESSSDCVVQTVYATQVYPLRMIGDSSLDAVLKNIPGPSGTEFRSAQLGVSTSRDCANQQRVATVVDNLKSSTVVYGGSYRASGIFTGTLDGSAAYRAVSESAALGAGAAALTELYWCVRWNEEGYGWVPLPIGTALQPIPVRFAVPFLDAFDLVGQYAERLSLTGSDVVTVVPACPYSAGGGRHSLPAISIFAGSTPPMAPGGVCDEQSPARIAHIVATTSEYGSHLAKFTIPRSIGDVARRLIAAAVATPAPPANNSGSNNGGSSVAAQGATSVCFACASTSLLAIPSQVELNFGPLSLPDTSVALAVWFNGPVSDTDFLRRAACASLGGNLATSPDICNKYVKVARLSNSGGTVNAAPSGVVSIFISPAARLNDDELLELAMLPPGATTAALERVIRESTSMTLQLYDDLVVRKTVLRVPAGDTFGQTVQGQAAAVFYAQNQSLVLGAGLSMLIDVNNQSEMGPTTTIMLVLVLMAASAGFFYVIRGTGEEDLDKNGNPKKQQQKSRPASPKTPGTGTSVASLRRGSASSTSVTPAGAAAAAAGFTAFPTDKGAEDSRKVQDASESPPPAAAAARPSAVAAHHTDDADDIPLVVVNDNKTPTVVSSNSNNASAAAAPTTGGGGKKGGKNNKKGQQQQQQNQQQAAAASAATDSSSSTVVPQLNFAEAGITVPKPEERRPLGSGSPASFAGDSWAEFDNDGPPAPVGTEQKRAADDDEDAEDPLYS